MELAAKRQRLYRDPENGFLGGVCAGIAERLNIDVLLARTTAIVLSAITFGIAVAIYLILWVVLPTKPFRKGVIEVKPRNAHSERYDTIIAAREAASAAGQENGPGKARAGKQQPSEGTEGIAQGAAEYRFSLILLALFCFLITFAIAALVNFQESMNFMEFIPLYLIPLGIFFITSPGSSRPFAARICTMILCFEMCSLLLPFTIGICNFESIERLTSLSILLWFIAIVFLAVGIAFNNSVCFMLSIFLVFIATGSSFYDFGFFVTRANIPLQLS